MSELKIQVGNVEIVALSDISCAYPTPLMELWPQVAPEAWQVYRERYPDTFEGDLMRLEIGCYLVRSQGRTVLIDTGYGPGPINYVGGLRGQLMADLASKKVRPEDVDLVFLSHLHLDHVGWNTTDQGGMLVPTFPRAGYMVHQADLEHFRRPEIQAAARYPYMERCVEPLVSLGVLDALEGDTDLSDELRAIHTPGHTPGHMSVLVASSGEQALIQGDVLIHPAQVTEDDWCPRFDGNFEEATQTRRRILDQVESERIAVVSCHFPAPGLGRVVRYQGRRYWQVGLVSDQGN